MPCDPALTNQPRPLILNPHEGQLMRYKACNAWSTLQRSEPKSDQIWLLANAMTCFDSHLKAIKFNILTGPKALSKPLEKEAMLTSMHANTSEWQ